MYELPWDRSHKPHNQISLMGEWAFYTGTTRFKFKLTVGYNLRGDVNDLFFPVNLHIF